MTGTGGKASMAKVELPYVKAYADRHGRRRCYFRKPGFQSVALPGLPGSPEFMAAYEQAVAGVTAPKRQIGQAQTKPGSLNALIVAYYQSSDFRGLAASTQATRRNILERLRPKDGDRRVAQLQRKHVSILMAEWSGPPEKPTPEAANGLHKALRALMVFAVAEGWRGDDPTQGVSRLKNASDGFAPWSEDDIALYEKRWPLGTRERLALALLLYTAVRRSDVVELGRQHLSDGRIHVRPVKTRRTSGERVALPVHPHLQAAIDAMPRTEMTFLLTAYGEPFSAAGFGNWFVASVKQAGLPAGRTAHGLRKATGRRLAEAGATAHEIMAVLVHATLAEAERYTRDAERKRLAAAGMAKLKGAAKDGK